MNAVQSLWLVFTLVASSVATGSTPVDCCPEMCVLDNNECVTKGVYGLYNDTVCGCGGMDPLTIKSFERPDAAYSFTDITLTGLCDCVVKNGEVNTNNHTYVYLLSCPKLGLTYVFYQKAPKVCSDPVKIQVTVTAWDYVIESTLNYGVFISKGDNLPHFYTQDACRKVKLEGKMKYTPKGTCGTQDIPVTDTNYIVPVDFGSIVVKAMEIVGAGMNNNTKKSPMGKILPANKDEL